MRRLILITIITILALPCYAADWTWTREDTIREVAVIGLTIVDWGQTNDIVARDDRVELNPILGPHPSRRDVDRYFAGVILLHPLIARALPSQADILGYKAKPRIVWQYFYIGVEATAIGSNYRGGLRMRF